MFLLRVPAGGALLLATLLLGVPKAQAQLDFGVGEQRYRSPKNFALELHLGPYKPDVDSEFSHLAAEDRPHQKYFGTDRHLLTRLELDYQFFNGFGSLGVGFSIGYFSQKGNALVETRLGEPDEKSGDPTGLMLIPTALSLVYRFDVLPLRWGIPLVPYAKAGLDWVYWSVSDGNGNVPKHGAGGRGRGGTPGFHGAFGIAFMLDVFDPGAAQSFDAETGINHTYLFVELRHAQINGLGRSDRLHVGDTTWSAGLMLEF